MTYSSVIEQTYDELQTFIMAHLPKVLAEYSLEQKPELKVPNQILRGDYQLQDIKSFPAIIFNPGSIEVNPSGEQKPVNKDCLVFSISIWLCNSINTSTGTYTQIEALQKLGERYAWAIKEIIDSSIYKPTQTTLLNSIRRVTNFDWSALEDGNNCKLSAAFVDIELKTFINRI